MQVPNVAASVHDSVNTVGSAAISKAIQQAQAQAQAHGMGSQVKPLTWKTRCRCTSAGSRPGYMIGGEHKQFFCSCDALIGQQGQWKNKCRRLVNLGVDF